MPLTPADLPPELFPTILEYVGRNENGYGFTEDGHYDVMRCSLVCMYWAKRCRERLFQNGAIRIHSATALATLQAYTTNGCARLVPLVHLARCLSLEQDWEGPTWCHRLHGSPVYLALLQRDSYFTISLRGPVPQAARLPRAAHCSPHWTLPRSLPHCFLPFTLLKLTDIHFPCLSDIYRLVGQFRFLEDFWASKITWGTNDIRLSAPRALTPNPRTFLARAVVGAEECTDNALICMLAFRDLVPLPDAPLLHMSAAQFDACLALMTAISTVDVERGASVRRVHLQVLHDENSFNEHDPNATPLLTRSLRRRVVGTSLTTHEALADLDHKLDIEAELWLSCEQTPASLVVSALRLTIVEGSAYFGTPRSRSADELDEQWQFISLVIRSFHSKFGDFPSIRSIELNASLHFLQHATKISPELAHVASFDTGPPYFWTCPRSDFAEDVASKYEPQHRVGMDIILDPLTLKPSERYRAKAKHDAPQWHAKSIM